MTFLNEQTRAMIGLVGPTITTEPLDPDRLRRFVHAVMEEDPVHWDAAAARASRYGDLVAPPLWPLHSEVRKPGDPDPFEAFGADPDWDGTPRLAPGGLPPLPIPLKRVLNGGTRAEFHQLAKIGDVVTAQSKYVDIVEREGRSGPMVIASIETTYTNQDDEVLAVVTMSIIWR